MPKKDHTINFNYFIYGGFEDVFNINPKWIFSKLLGGAMHGAVIGAVCLGIYGITSGHTFLLVGGAILGALAGTIISGIFLAADEFIGGNSGQMLAGIICGLLVGFLYGTIIEVIFGAVIGAVVPTAIHNIFRYLNEDTSDIPARVIGGTLCGLFLGTIYGIIILAGPWFNYWSVAGTIAGAVWGLLYPMIDQTIEKQVWGESW